MEQKRLLAEKIKEEHEKNKFKDFMEPMKVNNQPVTNLKVIHSKKKNQKSNKKPSNFHRNVQLDQLMKTINNSKNSSQ